MKYFFEHSRIFWTSSYFWFKYLCNIINGMMVMIKPEKIKIKWKWAYVTYTYTHFVHNSIIKIRVHKIDDVNLEMKVVIWSFFPCAVRVTDSWIWVVFVGYSPYVIPLSSQHLIQMVLLRCERAFEVTFSLQLPHFYEHINILPTILCKRNMFAMWTSTYRLDLYSRWRLCIIKIDFSSYNLSSKLRRWDR